MLPLEPINNVGRSGCSLGPSDEIKTSEAKSSFCCLAKSANPGDPDSSPVSIKIFELKPRQPLVSSMLFSAPIFTVCWPLLSAVPRP